MGWLAGPLGVTAGPVASYLPIVLMAVLFGLAMDYEVFLASRIREDYTRSRNPRQAIIAGGEAAARVVVAAALIMTCIFASFLLSGDATIKSLALALAVGVARDGQLLPAAGSLDSQASAERPGGLLAQIHDPYLHAVSQLAMAWASMIVGDSCGGIRQASVSLEELRGQDEPYWTAVAVLTVGYIEKAAGHYDAALRHLSEAHALADRSGYAWLATWSRVQLGTLAVARGRLDEARALLDEELAVSLAAGAVEGLRRRAGLGVWPEPQRGEADLATQIRQALGADQFDQVYAAGARLSRREAVAAARDQRSGSRAS